MPPGEPADSQSWLLPKHSSERFTHGSGELITLITVKGWTEDKGCIFSFNRRAHCRVRFHPNVNTMVPQLQHWTAKPNTVFTYVSCSTGGDRHQSVNMMLLLCKTKGKEILDVFFTPAMFFLDDFVVFFFFCTVFVDVVYFWMQLARCLYVRDYFDDTFICSKLKILFL